MSIKLIADKVYKRLAYRKGKFPTWYEAQKLLQKERIKQGKTCLTEDENE